MTKDPMIKPSEGKAAQLARAFTIAELILSVMVIAILIAIVIPSTTHFKKRAFSSKCIANLKELGAVISTYATENDGLYPASYSMTNPDGSNARYWYNILQDGPGGLGSNQGILPNRNTSNSDKVRTVYQCPANPCRLDLWRDPNYAYNRALGTIDAMGGVAQKVRLVNIPAPSKTVVLVDAGLRGKSSRSPLIAPADRCWDRTRSIDRASTVGYDWHDKTAHFLMADGHLEAIGSKEVDDRFTAKTLCWEF